MEKEEEEVKEEEEEEEEKDAWCNVARRRCVAAWRRQRPAKRQRGDASSGTEVAVSQNSVHHTGIRDTCISGASG